MVSMTVLDHDEVKLGRMPSPGDRRTVLLDDFLDASALGPPPPSVDWTPRLSKLGPMGNNHYGNCVFAGMGHKIQVVTANEAGEYIVPDDIVVKTYLDFTGGIDAGANILQALNFFRTKGLGGHRIWAYAAVNPHDHDLVKHTINTFGGAYFGVNLPTAWKNAPTWSTGRGFGYRAGSWGGHCVEAPKYSDAGPGVISWGQIIPCTWDAWDAYVDEVYAVISPDWIAKAGSSPNGIDLPRLRDVLNQITGIPATTVMQTAI